jgi:hypothetical protein
MFSVDVDVRTVVPQSCLCGHSTAGRSLDFNPVAWAYESDSFRTTNQQAASDYQI